MPGEPNQHSSAPLHQPAQPRRRILALDVGSRTIGMAISDELGILARGLPTLRRKSKRVDIETIGAILHQYDIGEIVVGHPLRLGGESSAQTGRIAALAAELRARLGVPVQLWDERLTSVAAEEALGLKRSVKQRIADRKSGAVDRIAAVIILQNYLDTRR
ncbi:MAG: Holliday junction resolvase RuvX [Terriglobales bacterium]